MKKTVDMERITVTLEDMMYMPDVMRQYNWETHWSRAETWDKIRTAIKNALLSHQLYGWQRRALTAIYASNLLMFTMVQRVCYTKKPERMIRLAVYLYRKAEKN